MRADMSRGQKTKKLILTKEKIDKIVLDISNGSTIKAACLSNGVARCTFYEYLDAGELDLADKKTDTLDAYFVQELYKVKKHEIIACRQLIFNNERGHKGAEWTLEHAYAEDFSSAAALHALLNEKLDRLLLNKAKDLRVDE